MTKPAPARDTPQTQIDLERLQGNSDATLRCGSGAAGVVVAACGSRGVRQVPLRDMVPRRRRGRRAGAGTGDGSGAAGRTQQLGPARDPPDAGHAAGPGPLTPKEPPCSCGSDHRNAYRRSRASRDTAARTSGAPRAPPAPARSPAPQAGALTAEEPHSGYIAAV
jgi:hypothetical protein